MLIRKRTAPKWSAARHEDFRRKQAIKRGEDPDAPPKPPKPKRIAGVSLPVVRGLQMGDSDLT